MRPVLLRPPFLVSFSVSAFSGFDFVTSAKSETDMWRRPGLVGLNLRTGITRTPPNGRLRARPRTPRRGALQPRPRCETAGRWPRSKLRSLEDLDGVAGLQLHHGLLPALARALEGAATLRLRLDLDHVHACDLDLEELLDGVPDLRLVRVGMDAERVAPARRVRIRLLADDRGKDDLARVHGYSAFPCTSGSAASLTSSERAQTTAPTSTSLGPITTTRSRLRKLLMRFVSSASATS